MMMEKQKKNMKIVTKSLYFFSSLSLLHSFIFNVVSHFTFPILLCWVHIFFSWIVLKKREKFSRKKNFSHFNDDDHHKTIIITKLTISKYCSFFSLFSGKFPENIENGHPSIHLFDPLNNIYEKNGKFTCQKGFLFLFYFFKTKKKKFLSKYVWPLMFWRLIMMIMSFFNGEKYFWKKFSGNISLKKWIFFLRKKISNIQIRQKKLFSLVSSNIFVLNLAQKKQKVEIENYYLAHFHHSILSLVVVVNVLCFFTEKNY